MFPSHPWLRRRAGAWILIGTLVVWNSGCQQWSLRPEMPSLLAQDDEDDWAPPVKARPLVAESATSDKEKRTPGWWGKRPESSPPRVVLPRNRKPAEPEAPRLAASQPPADASASVVAFGANAKSAPGNIVSAPSPVATPGQPAASAPAASAPAASAAAAPKVVDTGVTDVDIEGALQSLPNEYRDVIKKTLAAVKEGSLPPASTSLEEAASPTKPAVSVRIADEHIARNDAESRSEPLPNAAPLTDVQTAVAATPPPSAAPSTSVVTASATESSKPASEKVTAKLNESSVSDIVPSSWHQTTSSAIEALERQLESSPPADDSMRMSLEITLRMLYVAQRRLDDALRPVDRLTEHEQEYVRHQMQALYEASNPDANPARSRHWSLVMNSQREATSHLAAVSNLEVRGVSFCTQVDGYGVYQRFAKNQFTPDQDVLLYCEIDNVAAEQVKLGFETQLQGSYEIRDSQGRRVAEQLLPMEPELCQNHRRDYFIVYRIYMPQQIPPGDYQLRLTIEDMKGRKFGQSTADFMISK